MSKQWYTCDFSSPLQALAFFASLAREPLFQQAGSDFWKDWRVSLSSIFSGVTFHIPDRLPDFTLSQRKQREQWEAYYEKLRRYCQQTGSNPWRHGGSQPPDDALSLAAGLTSLLFPVLDKEQRPYATSPVLAQPIDNEYLIIAQDIDHEQTLGFVNMFRYYATSARVAVLQSPQGNRWYFFHVLADSARKAAFPSTLTGGYWDRFPVLRAYRARPWKVFISSSHAPIAERLSLFTAIAARLPAIFDGHPTDDSHDGLLMAMVLSGDEKATTSPRLWHLGGCVFHDVTELEPVRPIPFEVVSFTPSPTFFDDLERHIQDVAKPGGGYVGYRLELRPTRYEDKSEKRYMRIQEKIQALRDDLALLESLGKGRPRLLRFSQRQLPALVDVLRAYPMDVLKQDSEGRGESERLLYLFQSYEWPARSDMAADQQGFHYLYVPASLVGTILSRLLLWWETDDPPAEFWIDPFWGNYYFDDASTPLVHVFTPRGTALHPLIHTWDKRQEAMEQYLREMMGRWFHGRAGVSSIPNRPIYLFDHDDPSSSSIRITVLDYEQFKPLHMKLGWLNDNLITMNAQDLGLESFIQQMAHDATRRNLAEDLNRQAETAQENFQQTARALEQHLAQHTLRLTTRLTQELRGLVNEIEELTKKLKETDEKLLKLSHIRQNMEILVEKGEAEAHHFQHECEQTKEYIRELREEVKRLVSQAEAQRTTSEQRVLGAIMRIKNTRQELKARIHKW